MYEKLTIETPGLKNYDIVLTNTFDELPNCLTEAGLHPDKIAVIADSHTAPLYGQAVCDVMAAFADDICLITIPSGEIHKNLETITTIYDELVEKHFSRKSLLLSLGGGVVCDMTGFVAATYMRGIAFAQLPTTLLSQIDASIGGKTGFDYHGYKNMIGAFHMPSLVYINAETLRTLPDREIKSGMAEVVKSALIKDAALYDWLKDNTAAINGMDMKTVASMIARTCRIKQTVVEHDPYEHGERKHLNYGHTIGHAIEKSYGFTYTHGECVGLGMLCINAMCVDKQMMTAEEAAAIKQMLVDFDLPVTVANMNSEDVVANTKSDKKRMNNTIDFVVLDGIGQATIERAFTDDDMRRALKTIEG